MRHFPQSRLALVVLPLLLGACTAETDTAETSATTPATAIAPADRAADEQAIRELDRNWSDAAGRRDAASFASVYAADGYLMPPNAPAAQGPEAIQSLMGGLLAPNVTLGFTPAEIQVAEAGDMAYDRGTYRMEIATDGGTTVDEGKYLVIWKKVGGEWKVAADVFNSDKPAG